MAETQHLEAGADRAGQLEYRELRVELRADREGGGIVMEIPYDRETVIGGYFREVIRPGAFRRSIAERRKVVAWYQHGEGGQLPLGTTTASPATLDLQDGQERLVAVAHPPDRPWVEDLRAAVERGEVDGASFSFSVPPGGAVWRWSESDDELPLRELVDVDLWDVSPVVFPAYSGSSTALRSGYRTPEDVLRASQPAGDQAAASDTTNEQPGQAVDVLRCQLEMIELEALNPHLSKE